jgi:hypothetical protein
MPSEGRPRSFRGSEIASSARSLSHRRYTGLEPMRPPDEQAHELPQGRRFAFQIAFVRAASWSHAMPGQTLQSPVVVVQPRSASSSHSVGPDRTPAPGRAEGQSIRLRRPRTDEKLPSSIHPGEREIAWWGAPTRPSAACSSHPGDDRGPSLTQAGHLGTVHRDTARHSSS